MGPRYTPYSRKCIFIQWGVSNGPHVRHDTRLPHTSGTLGLRYVRETAPEHALVPSTGAGHASGQGTLGTSSGSSESSSCLRPTFVGVPLIDGVRPLSVKAHRGSAAPRLYVLTAL